MGERPFENLRASQSIETFSAFFLDSGVHCLLQTVFEPLSAFSQLSAFHRHKFCSFNRNCSIIPLSAAKYIRSFFTSSSLTKFLNEFFPTKQTKGFFLILLDVITLIKYGEE
jgi:hypothetical protein